jgi:hypothetical protein
VACHPQWCDSGSGRGDWSHDVGAIFLPSPDLVRRVGCFFDPGDIEGIDPAYVPTDSGGTLVLPDVVEDEIVDPQAANHRSGSNLSFGDMSTFRMDCGCLGSFMGPSEFTAGYPGDVPYGQMCESGRLGLANRLESNAFVIKMAGAIPGQSGSPVWADYHYPGGSLFFDESGSSITPPLMSLFGSGKPLNRISFQHRRKLYGVLTARV